MITDNQLARRIESKVLGGWCGGRNPRRTRGFRGRSPPNVIFFSDINDYFFAYVSDDFRPKKNCQNIFLSKIFCQKIIGMHPFFVNKFFCCCLKSSETYAIFLPLMRRGGGGGEIGISLTRNSPSP